MKRSAGILLFRKTSGILEFFLVHPGGPFWRSKDEGAWSIPKGEYGDDEDPLCAAIREFVEETGFQPEGQFIPLSPIRLKSGKWVFAWGLEKDIDPSLIQSDEFEVEWPPKSGQLCKFPEVDRAAWFDAPTALAKINEAQGSFITELERMV